MQPETDAQLFDMLHGLFGFGDFEEDGSEPWHHFRMVEISKIKAIRKKRRWTIPDFVLVARHCADTGVRIDRVWDLLAHYAAAKAADVANARLRREERVREAIAAELASGLPDSAAWVQRLELSTGRGRLELLEEWESTRQRTLAPGMS